MFLKITQIRYNGWGNQGQHRKIFHQKKLTKCRVLPRCLDDLRYCRKHKILNNINKYCQKMSIIAQYDAILTNIDINIVKVQ